MSFLGLLNHSITVYNKSSRNRYGKEQFGSGTSVKARIEQSDRTIYNAPIGLSGQSVEIVPIAAKLFVPADTAVELGDKITAVATDEASETISYKVIRKHVAVDGRATARHIELEVSKWQV